MRAALFVSFAWVVIGCADVGSTASKPGPSLPTGTAATSKSSSDAAIISTVTLEATPVSAARATELYLEEIKRRSGSPFKIWSCRRAGADWRVTGYLEGSSGGVVGEPVSAYVTPEGKVLFEADLYPQAPPPDEFGLTPRAR